MTQRVLSRVEFLDHYLGELEKVELVYALWKSQRPVSLQELAALIRVPLATVVELLRQLERDAVISIDGDLVRLGPTAEDAAFTELMTEYDEDRLAVITTLSRLALNRVRAMAARAFAEAFVIRKSKKPGGSDG